MEHLPSKDWVDMGAWVGRQQAFGVMAKNCTAAQAQCLKQARESHGYEELGLTWEELCKEHFGLSREHADNLIRQYEKFGESYFKLSSIARVSPATYTAIEANIKGETLVWDGEELAITPENAHKIRAAVRALRDQLKVRHAAPPADAVPPRNPAVRDLESRLDAIVKEYAALKDGYIAPERRPIYFGIIDYAIRRLTKLQKDLSL